MDTTLLDINHNVPDILTPRKNRWFSIPMQKNEDFFISSIIFTEVNFKVLCCFLICYSVLSWHAMKSDSNHDFPMYGTLFAFFGLVNKNNN